MMIELAGLAGILMLLGCIVPQDFLPRGLPHDGLLHTGAFALLSLPFCLSANDMHDLVKVSLGVWTFGLAIECIQHFIPTRRFGLDDLLYNAAGVLLVALPSALLLLF